MRAPLKTRPRRLAGLAVAALLASIVPRALADETKTYFEHIGRAWAVGEVRVSSDLKFRDGMLLAYPGRIIELLHARNGKPQTIMLVYERTSAEDQSPFIPTESFVGPIAVLPRYAYWRDSLPNVPHHAVLGGRRNVFTGAAMEPAKKITSAYVATLALHGKPRWEKQNGVFVDSLHAGVSVLREDAVRHLAKQLPLTKALDPDATKKLTAFLAGDFPQAERAELARAVGEAELGDFSKALAELAKRDDLLGASAIGALAKLGKPRSTKQLIELSAADSVEVRGYAFEELGARAIDNDKAFTAATAVLDSAADPAIRAAAARGLGRSGAERAVLPLRKALFRGDDASRAAGAALATVGNAEAVTALKEAVVDAPGNGKVGAVLAIIELRDSCADCRDYLVGLYETHDEEAIRDLIGIVLDLGPGNQG